MSETPIQAAVDGAGTGDVIACGNGSRDENLTAELLSPIEARAHNKKEYVAR